MEEAFKSLKYMDSLKGVKAEETEIIKTIKMFFKSLT